MNKGMVLMSRRANTGWQDGKLCAPGGHVEEGETPTQGMIREIHEELGVEVKAEDLEFSCVAQRKTESDEYVAFEFVLRDKNYKFENTEPEKCSELVWVDPTNLPEDIIEDFRIIIESSINSNKKFIEIGY